MAKHSLGRGLEALIRDGAPSGAPAAQDSPLTVEVKKVQKSPELAVGLELRRAVNLKRKSLPG